MAGRVEESAILSRAQSRWNRTLARRHPRIGRVATALTTTALAFTVTTVAASATVASCLQPTNGPAPQVRATGYETATVHDTNYPIPTHALFVANNGNDHNSGTISAPLATIRKAITIAPAGGTIVVRGGVYRESLGALPRRVTIQAYPHEAPWVSGSVTMEGFVPVGGAWVAPWTSPFCDSCYPIDVLDPLHPAAGLPEQVFVDGAPLAQVTDRSLVTAGTFYVDPVAGQLVLGDDPTGHVIDVTQRASALSISAPASGSVIRGIGFEHWGTLYKGDAAVVVRTNATFDNDTIAWSAARGLQLFGANDVVTNSAIVDNGMSGMNTYGARTLDFERNEVAYSNFEHWSIAPSKVAELAGVKTMNTGGSVFRFNYFHDNDSNALWFDQYASNQVVVRNIIVHNSGHGLAVEISGPSIVAGNVVAENGRDGVKLSGASDTAVYNNTVVNNGWAEVGVYEDPRHANGGITLVNDIFMAGPLSVKRMLNSYDIDQPAPLTTLQMIASDDHNVWGRTNANRPWNMGYVQTSATVCNVYRTLSSFSAASHRELASTSVDGRPLTQIFADPANNNYGIVPGATLAVPALVPANIAAALGTGTQVPHVGA